MQPGGNSVSDFFPTRRLGRGCIRKVELSALLNFSYCLFGLKYSYKTQYEEQISEKHITLMQ